MMSYYTAIKMMFMECLMTSENVNDLILSKKCSYKIALTILSETCKNCIKNEGILQNMNNNCFRWWNYGCTSPYTAFYKAHALT